jgi:hypothetical protein
MTQHEPAAPGGLRPTTIGPFNGRQGETNRTRTIPVPWIDCTKCSLRHYPSTTKGRWFMATACMGCGTELTIPVEADPAA